MLAECPWHYSSYVTLKPFRLIVMKAYKGVSFFSGAKVAERLNCLPPTKVNRVESTGGSLRILNVGFVPDDAAGQRVLSGISRFPPPFHFGADPYSLRFTISGSQDLVVKGTRKPDEFLSHADRRAHARFFLLLQFSSCQYVAHWYVRVEQTWVPPPAARAAGAVAPSPPPRTIPQTLLLSRTHCPLATFCEVLRDPLNPAASSCPTSECNPRGSGIYRVPDTGVARKPDQCSPSPRPLGQKHNILLNIPNYVQREDMIFRGSFNSLVMNARLPPRRSGFNRRPGNFGIFASGSLAGRCRWSAGFLGDLPFPPPLHSGAAPFSPYFTHICSQDLVKSLHGATPECKGEEKREIPDETPPTSGIVRHDSYMRKSERNGVMWANPFSDWLLEGLRTDIACDWLYCVLRKIAYWLGCNLTIVGKNRQILLCNKGDPSPPLPFTARENHELIRRGAARWGRPSVDASDRGTGCQLSSVDREFIDSWSSAH
ncbi:hypothetical protein PR048_028757 [Dryococelus australis]|uniref:Uncharacterized protein n=1 Tax=Dryococelus australis TaxID=614101 RepID=A0ABQ9GBF6_9NEOP|nr:hypothetical protein PR048_028757 [Dryococelus australis]